MNLLKLLKKIDIFGRRIELRLDKHKKHKTYCGAVATVFIFFFTILVAWIYISQFFNHESLQLRIYDLKQSDEININDPSVQYNIDFMVQIIDSQTNQIVGTDSFVFVANQIRNKDGGANTIENQIKLELCQEDQAFYCLPKDSKFLLTAPYNSEKIDFLQLKIIECPQWVQQSGQKINCQSQANINSIMKTAKVKAKIMQYEINPKNYGQPISPSQKIYTTDLINSDSNTNTSSLLKLIVQQTVLTTDQGWILEGNTDNYINSLYSASQQSLSSSGSSLLTIEINIYNQKHFIERTYSKLQVYLAYIGGILKMLMILGECLTRPFVRLSLSIKIVNEVFDFEGGESEGGSTDVLSYEEFYNDHKVQNNENQIQRGSSLQSLEKQRQFSPSTFEGMANSYLKNERPPLLFKCNPEQKEPHIQTSSLIKIQKTEQINCDYQGILEKNRNRTISIIQEHHNDNNSISTPQNYNRQSRDTTSPIVSNLGLKKLSQNGSSNKQSKTSIDENIFINQQKIQNINNEESSQFERTQIIKQTFQPINIIGQLEKHNNKSKESLFLQNYETPKLPFGKQKSNSSSSEHSSSSSSQSSSSSSSSSQQSSQRSKDCENKNRQKKLSSSLPSSPKLNQLVNNQVPSPSYAQHKSDRQNFRAEKKEQSSKQKNLLDEKPQSRQSQKITGDIEEMINTPNCIKLISQQMAQNQQVIKNKNMQLTVETNFLKPNQNQFLSLNEQSINSKRSKSILKNGNAVTIRHSYSIGDCYQDSNLQIPEEYSPQRKNIQQITFCQPVKSSNLFDERSPQKSDYSSQRYSPNYRARFSAVSSPDRDSNHSPSNKQHNSKNISFSQQPQNLIKPFNLIDRRSQSVQGVVQIKSFHKMGENNIYNPNDSQNLSHLQNNDKDNMRERNSSQAQHQINIQRHSSKRMSFKDQQRIIAAQKLMSNFQNHQQTPMQALRDYGKLADSPKKQFKNADSIFKKLLSQGKVLKMQFYDYFTFYLQCFKGIYSEKKKQIKYSKQRVKERLDVVYIMQKLVEIDKLKMLVLNDDQIKLFEYLPKPIVHVNSKDMPSSPSLKNSNKPYLSHNTHHPQNMQQAWSILHQQKNSLQKATEAQEVYQNMIQNNPEQLTSIDRKLLEMIDVRIQKIFENQIANQRKNINLQMEINNSILLNRVHTDQINNSNLENNITKDNLNETNNLFLDPQIIQSKTNTSQIHEKPGNQNLKSLDEITFTKTEENGILSNKNQSNSKNFQNKFLYEFQQSLKKIDEESDQVKRQNSLNSSQKQKEQANNMSQWIQNMQSSKDSQLKKVERVV